MEGGKSMSVRIEDIPQMAIDDLIERIGTNTQEKLFKFVLIQEANTRETMHSYIRCILNDYFLCEDGVIDLSEIKNTFHRRRQLNKRNWYKQLEKQVKDNQPNPIQRKY